MGVSTDKLSQAFSMALEHRNRDTKDLVTNSNVLLKLMKDKNLNQSYSGPTIRQRLQVAQTGTGTWYQGYDFLNPKPREIYQDAEWVPKMLAVSPTLTMEEVLQNQGRNQLRDLVNDYITAAQEELRDMMDQALHSDGTGYGGLELTGLKAAIPTVANTGTYGGISRADNTWWRTTTYDADTDFSGIGTQVSSTTVYPMWEKICIERTRGKKGPNLILASQSHYTAFSAALNDIQRINDTASEGTKGFTAMSFAAAGKKVDVVLEGGIQSNMPDDVTYFIDTSCLRLRYHPDRYFSRFGGQQTPVNQDAIVQHIGFMGELTMTSPLHMAKFYDSDTGS